MIHDGDTRPCDLLALLIYDYSSYIQAVDFKISDENDVSFSGIAIRAADEAIGYVNVIDRYRRQVVVLPLDDGERDDVVNRITRFISSHLAGSRRRGCLEVVYYSDSVVRVVGYDFDFGVFAHACNFESATLEGVTHAAHRYRDYRIAFVCRRGERYGLAYSADVVAERCRRVRAGFKRYGVASFLYQRADRDVAETAVADDSVLIGNEHFVSHGDRDDDVAFFGLNGYAHYVLDRVFGGSGDRRVRVVLHVY